MRERDYYPAGAYNDPSAPYNETEVPEHEFGMNVQVTIAKTINVWTNDYEPEYDDETGRTYYHTLQTDWEKIYKENEPSIFECLEELKGYVKKELESEGIDYMRKRHLESLLNACDGWEEVETCFDEE